MRAATRGLPLQKSVYLVGYFCHAAQETTLDAIIYWTGLTQNLYM